jgi:hypothetical protein
MTTKIIRISSFLLLISLSACDCGFENKVEVFNYLNQPITVKYKIQSRDSSIIIIEPNKSEVLLAEFGGWCNCTNCKGDKINLADSSMIWLFQYIVIYKNDTIPTKTDYNKDYNWQFFSEKKLGYYKAFVEESDF